MNRHVDLIWRIRLAKFSAAAVTFAAIAFVPATTMLIEPTSVTVAHRAGSAFAMIPGKHRFPGALYLARSPFPSSDEYPGQARIALLCTP